MNIKSNRGIAILVALPYLVGVLVVGSVVYEYKKLTAPGRDQKQADQSAVTATISAKEAAQLKSDAQKAKDDLDTSNKAHAEQVAGLKAAAKAAAVDDELAKVTLESEPTQTPAELLASGYADDAQVALGVTFTKEQHDTYKARVLPLIQDRQKALEDVATERINNAKLASANQRLETRATTAEDVATKAVAGFTTETYAHAKDAKTAQDNAVKVQQWADQAVSWKGRLEALSVLLFLVVGSALYLMIKHLGLTQTTKDIAGWGNKAEELAKAAGVDIEAEYQKWMGGDSKAIAAHQAVKDSIRV